MPFRPPFIYGTVRASAGGGPILTQADVLAWADFEGNANQLASGTDWLTQRDPNDAWRWTHPAGVNGSALNLNSSGVVQNPNVRHRKLGGASEVAEGAFVLWCKATSTDTQRVQIAQSLAISNFTFQYTSIRTGNYSQVFQLRNSAGSLSTLSAGMDWSSFHMLAISWSGSEVNIWTDNSFRGTLPWDGTWHDGSANFAAGVETANNDNEILVDCMTLLNKPLTQEIVDFLYASGAGRNYGEIPA